MATSKTLTPTNVTIQIPDFTDRPDQRVTNNCIDKEADAINALNGNIATKATVAYKYTWAADLTAKTVTLPIGSYLIITDATGSQYGSTSGMYIAGLNSENNASHVSTVHQGTDYKANISVSGLTITIAPRAVAGRIIILSF